MEEHIDLPLTGLSKGTGRRIWHMPTKEQMQKAKCESLRKKIARETDKTTEWSKL
jgi:hypothetical protein